MWPERLSATRYLGSCQANDEMGRRQASTDIDHSVVHRKTIADLEARISDQPLTKKNP